MSKQFQQYFPHVTVPILATAVSGAGALGFIGAGYVTEPEWAATELAHAAAAITSSSSSNLARGSHGRLPIGIGFITWHLKASSSWPDVLARVLDARPAAIWFSFGDASSMIQWIREREKTLLPEGMPPCRIFVQVQTVAGALDAVRWGSEAGGHKVIDAIDNPAIPVLAAGGIADGRGLAAVLVMGAAAAVIGSRFVISKECPTSDAVKQAIIDTKDGGITTTKLDVFDKLRGFGWPEEYAIRTMRNRITDAYEQDNTMPTTEEFSDAIRRGDTTVAMVTTSQAVGLLNQLQSAAEIVEQIHAQAQKLLSRQ
ncbi:2-nitropropane dioxygenase [Syncephalis plumigaleata]|nr:2-nitropropane dioxygenase [Syncephalis plumigaleata]